VVLPVSGFSVADDEDEGVVAVEEGEGAIAETAVDEGDWR
jgi:hypothetical protein